MASLVKCTFPKCNRHFDTINDMIRHKQQTPDHDYCVRCDVDCEDDAELHFHKMVSPRHIACPICALDFKSEQGCAAHIRQAHPTHQQLICPGCRDVFSSAGALMSHIEKNQCKAIGVREFHEQRAKKQVLKAQFENRISSDPYTMTQCHPDSDVDSEVGGVSLRAIDQAPRTGEMDDKQISGRITDYESRLSKIDRPSLPGRVTNDDRWPNPAGYTYEHHLSYTFDPAGDLAVRVSNLGLTEGTPTGTHRALSHMKDTSKTSEPLSWKEEAPGWKDGEYRGVPKSVAGSVATTTYTDLSEYDANKFIDPFSGQFACPSSHCNRHFATEKDFNNHLLTGSHIGGTARCPCCFRAFRSITALVAHCESASRRCRISESTNYNLLLREISGGLLGTQGRHDDGTVKYVAPPRDFW